MLLPPNIQLLDLDAHDFTSIVEGQKLIGRHSLDSEENVQYVFTDVRNDDSSDQIIDSRHPLIPDINNQEENDSHVLAPAIEVDDHVYELDYYLRELRLSPNLGYTPHVSYADVLSHILCRGRDRGS